MIHHAGFLKRFAATLIDTLLLTIILSLMLYATYGVKYWQDPALAIEPKGVIINYIFPFAVTILLWNRFASTPGKMLFRLKIVDKNTLNEIPGLQSVKRYVGYFVSFFPFGLGFIWIAFDKQKRGFHDMIADTLVVYTPKEDKNSSGTGKL